jgi:voltage-gated potassium channel
MLPSDLDASNLAPEAPTRFRTSMLFLLALILLGTFGYMTLTHSSVFDSLYMTIISITTVGYSESINLEANPGARLFTMFLLVGGAGVTVYVSSNLTAFLVEGELSDILWSRKMDRKIRGLSNHVIIAGGGQTASYTVREMLMSRQPFVVIERSKAHFERMERDFPESQLLGLIGDATEDKILQAAGVERAQGLVSALPDDRDNLFVTISARGLNSNLRIVSKTVRQSSENKMRMAGADEVVCPDSIGGSRMASQILRPHVLSFLDAMIYMQENDSIRIEELTVNRRGIVGCSLAKLELPKKFGGMLVLALKRKDETQPVYNPKATLIRDKDVLIVMGESEWVEQARAYFEDP